MNIQDVITKINVFAGINVWVSLYESSLNISSLICLWIDSLTEMLTLECYCHYLNEELFWINLLKWETWSYTNKLGIKQTYALFIHQQPISFSLRRSNLSTPNVHEKCPKQHCKPNSWHSRIPRMIKRPHLDRGLLVHIASLKLWI